MLFFESHHLKNGWWTQIHSEPRSQIDSLHFLLDDRTQPKTVKARATSPFFRHLVLPWRTSSFFFRKDSHTSAYAYGRFLCPRIPLESDEAVWQGFPRGVGIFLKSATMPGTSRCPRCPPQSLVGRVLFWEPRGSSDTLRKSATTCRRPFECVVRMGGLEFRAGFPVDLLFLARSRGSISKRSLDWGFGAAGQTPIDGRAPIFVRFSLMREPSLSSAKDKSKV